MVARDRRYEATGLSGTGIKQLNDSNDESVSQKLPVQGRDFVSLTSIESGNDSGTLEVRGTNNPDTSDTNGETLLTNTHTGNDQQDARARMKGYDYVFVQQTAAGGSESLEAQLKLVG